MARTFHAEEDVTAYEIIQTDANVKKAQAAARASYDKISKAERVKLVQLEFAPGVQLSDGVSTADDEDYEVEYSIIPIPVDTNLTDKDGNKIFSILTRMSWTLYDLSTATDIQIRKVKATGRAKLGDAFNNLKIG